MGKRYYNQSFATSHVPFANEPPYVVGKTARHNHMHMEETMPKIKHMSPVAQERFQKKNLESQEAKERLGRPSQKNVSDPTRGEAFTATIKGKKHLEDQTLTSVKPRPIQYVEGGGTTAGGYMQKPL